MTLKDLYRICYPRRKPFEGEKQVGDFYFSNILAYLTFQEQKNSKTVGIIDLYCHLLHEAGLGLDDLELGLRLSAKDEPINLDARLFYFFHKDELFDECRDLITNMPQYMSKNFGIKGVLKSGVSVGELTQDAHDTIFLLASSYQNVYRKIFEGLNMSGVIVKNEKVLAQVSQLIYELSVLKSKYITQDFIKSFLNANEITPKKILESRKALLDTCFSLKYPLMLKMAEDVLQAKIQKLDEQISDDKKIENLIKIADQIIGQNDAIETIVNKLQSVFVGFKNENQPLASFLLTGPTGVGKTETAKAIASACFDGKFYVVDMSTFKHKSDVNRLLGSAPGYVGYGDTNEFCGFLTKNPSSVILFDEIEKADDECLDLLMRMLDEGQFINAKGQVVSMHETVIVCTTNLTQNTQRGIGFGASEPSTEQIITDAGLKKELVGRFSGVIEYKKLSREDCKKIAKQKFIKSIVKKFEKNNKFGLKIKCVDAVLDEILDEANTDLLGARDLKKAIQVCFIDPISNYIAKNHPKNATLTLKRGGVVVCEDRQTAVVPYVAQTGFEIAIEIDDGKIE